MLNTRKVIKTVQGQRAVDGAGVSLVRVLGHGDVNDFDPFLMLDSFDSTNPADYIKGFPMHPHRGIETITYLIEGLMEHEDSLGNKGAIKSGQCQWMTAGSGILHQEMPKSSPRMLGVQLWLNLPQSEKMTDAAYHDVTEEMISTVSLEGATLKVISGHYQGQEGTKPKYINATIYDIHLESDKSITLDTSPEENVFVFFIDGDGIIENKKIKSKTAVLFGEGDQITVTAPSSAPSRFLYLSAKPLKEPIAWGGPIVMNTHTELMHAFKELEQGTFIKHK